MSRRPQEPAKAKKKLNGARARAVPAKGKVVKAATVKVKAAPAKPKAAPPAKSKAAPPAKAKAKVTPAAKAAKAVPAAKPATRGAVNGHAGKPAAEKPKVAKTAPAVAPPARPAKNGSANGRLLPVSKAEIVLPAGYRPTEREPFMNELQRVYFRKKLVTWKEEILREGRSTLHNLHEDTSQHADLADRATSETDRAIELRARDRQRKLIAKIESALVRIEDGSYGFCEETGEPIGLKRLDARPIATLSIEAQERHERRERVYRDDRVE
jgi:DnaK suppressor protein